MNKIVKLIEKMAQGMPTPSKPRSHAPAAPGMPVPQSNSVPQKGIPSPGQSKSPVQQWTGSAKSINKMQQEINKFVESVTGSKDKALVAQKQQLNNFLSNQYGDDQPGSNVNLADSISKLSAKSKMHPGVWDAATQESLVNIYHFAKAFVTMSHDFGGIPHGLPFTFTNDDVEQLLGVASFNTKGIDPKEIIDLADAGTEYITKFNSFYNYYYQVINNHPSYRAYVADAKPLYTVKPDQSDPLANNKDLSGLNLSNVAMPSKNDPSGRIIVPEFPLYYMKDLNSFKEGCKDLLAYTEDDFQKDPSLLNKLLGAIKLNIQTTRQVKG